MDKERLVRFRSDLAKLKDLIKENPSPQYVDDMFMKLVVAYPELNEDERSLPDLVVKKKETSKHQMEKNIQIIKEELIESISEERFTDYTDVKVVMDNEQTCVDTLHTLARAIRKRIVYYSYLEGRVLKRLREISGKKMSQILKLTRHSQSSAYFLIKLYDLVQDHNKLMYSTLPLRYFKTNLKAILDICKTDEAELE